MVHLFGKKKQSVNKTIKISKEKQQGVRLYLNDEAYITVKTGNCSHQGGREYQEDSFGYSNITDSGVISEKGFLAVLADGMGGLSNGRAISDYVVSSFIKMFDTMDYNAPFNAQLEIITEKINTEVCKNFSKNGKSGAGSTVVAAFVYKARLYWLCVGDSRLYFIRNGYLYAANEDHDYFNELLLEHITGDLTMNQIHSEKQKDSLTSYIGNERLPYIDANKKGVPLCRGDTLVLCSDGVYNSLSDAEIIHVLKQNDPQRASEKIAQAVLDKNTSGQDNLTVMVIKLEE